MSLYVTIMTVALPSELIVPKSLLDAHEIEYKTLDELTIQVDNFLSNAMGGVKLQVMEEEAERAKQLLKEANFRIDDDEKPSGLSAKLNEPGFYKKFRLGAFVLIAAILLLVAYALLMN